MPSRPSWWSAPRPAAGSGGAAESLGLELLGGHQARDSGRLGGSQQAAALSVDAYRDVSVERDPAHQPGVVVEVGDRVVLRATVVPDRHVTDLPLPADDVLRALDMPLEQLDERAAVAAGDSLDTLGEVSQEQVPL